MPVFDIPQRGSEKSRPARSGPAGKRPGLLDHPAAELESLSVLPPDLLWNFGRIPIHPTPARAIQPKLAINRPGDPYEQEADRIADQVMRHHASANPVRAHAAAGVQRACACGGTCDHCKEEAEEPVQRASAEAGHSAPVHAPAVVHDALNSVGRPLDSGARAFFEPRLGYDFSRVRIHTGALADRSAESVQALAYTSGSNIVFARGKYAPHTGEGRRLLAHELVHVLQQSSANGTVPESDHDQYQGVAGRTAPAMDGRRPRAADRETGLLQRTPAPPAWQGITGVQDEARLTIDAIADFVASTVTPRDIHAHINDGNVTHISWELYDPADKFVTPGGGFSTLPGRPASTTAPFHLDPATFSGAGFTPGSYTLRCVGRNASHQPIVYADRDFNALKGDLTTGTALATTHGALTFTKYKKTDANPPATPRYSVDVELSFLPDASVTCADVAFMQSMQTIDNEGKSQQNTVNAEQDARKTPLTWAIDRVAGAPSPFYIAGRNPAGHRIDDPGWGAKGHGNQNPGPATLIDQPSWNHENDARFESCAICRSGADTGKVFGCATWGYTATAAGAVTLMPRSFHDMPSEHFEEARAAWNNWRSTRPQASRPDEAPALAKP
ncbi:MAG TPA: DUF4157 domain-containing protein [Acidobacteriaceae bacterium]